MRLSIVFILILNLSFEATASQSCRFSFSPKQIQLKLKEKKLTQYKETFRLYSKEAEKYPQIIKDATEILDIPKKELLRRLVSTKVSPSELYRQVEIESSEKKNPFLKLLMQPEIITGKIRESIKSRQIVDPNFLRNFVEMAAIHSGAQAITHMLKFDFAAMGILSAQLGALLITEVALTFSSAKTISYLIANRQQLEQAKQSVQNLSNKEKLIFYSFSAKLKNMLQNFNSRELMGNTYKKIPKLAKIAFVTSLVPFGILAFGKEAAMEDMIGLTLLNASFHALFISVWANFRYELFYGQLFPLIKNSNLAGNNKFLERNLIRVLMGINMVVASYSYSAGSDASYQIFGKEFE